MNEVALKKIRTLEDRYGSMLSVPDDHPDLLWLHEHLWNATAEDELSDERKQTLENIRAFVAAGKTVREIALLTGFTVQHINAYLKRHHITLLKPYQVKLVSRLGEQYFQLPQHVKKFLGLDHRGYQRHIRNGKPFKGYKIIPGRYLPPEGAICAPSA